MLHVNCVFVSSRSPFQCAMSRSVLWVVVFAEPPCARRWAGRTVVRGFTAPSVGNSVKVRFNIKGAVCNIFTGCKQTKKRVLDARNSSLQELT